MATTLTRPRTSPMKPEELRLGVTRTRRRPWLALGSAALIATCTAGFTSVYLRAGHQVGVLAVARPVAQGATITSDDVVVARLSFSAPLAPIGASDVDEVVGHAAAVALVPGTLLTRADLSTGSPPASGEAVVGVAAKPGQLPAGGVVPGETVDVVLTGSPGATDVVPLSNGTTDPNSGGATSPGTMLLADAVVSDVAASPASSGSDTTVVSLVVPSAEAGAVASASAAGQAALVVVSPRS